MTRVIRVKTPGGIEQFEVADIEIPPPAADEVRIRQTAIGVNFIDIDHLREQIAQRIEIERIGLVRRKHALPCIGRESAR